MLKFEWKKEYELGHLMLDKEHQELFNIANEAFFVVEPSQKKNKIAAVIKRLTDYLNVHIQHEEDYMLSIGYPHLDIEKKMHEKMREDFNKWKKDYSNKLITVIEKELAHNIEISLISHIKYEDVKMRHWCEKHNIDLRGIAWKDTYLIGNDIVDKEHKHLFKIANEAFSYTPAYKRKDKIKHTIHELYGYMKEHFVHEEELMRSIKYPELELHTAMHQAIEVGMNSFSKNIPTMSLAEIEEQLALFIEEWVVLHVINEDNKIGQWKINSEKSSVIDEEIVSDIDITEENADKTKG